MDQEQGTWHPHTLSMANHRRKAPRRFARIALLGGTVSVIVALIAGALVVYHLSGAGIPTVSADSTPLGDLRTIAKQAGFPVLTPTWLPNGMELTAAAGDATGQGYDVTLDYGFPPPRATPELRYHVVESSDVALNVSYQFVDPSGASHTIQMTDTPVAVNGVHATLREYSCVWRGQVVLHALAVFWIQNGALYNVAAQDVFPEAYAANAPAVLHVLTLPSPASRAELLRMASSFRPVQK